MSLTLTQGARLLTAMLPLNTVAYDPSPQSTDSLIVILEIGGELVDQISGQLEDAFDE